MGTPAGICTATFPPPVRPNVVISAPGVASASASSPTPRLTVFPGSGSATATAGSPFVGQPVSKGVRFTTLHLRGYGTLLVLRDDLDAGQLVTYSTLLVFRGVESDLDGRHTSSRLVRTL